MEALYLGQHELMSVYSCIKAPAHFHDVTMINLLKNTAGPQLNHS